MASRVITLEGSATRWAFLLVAACALTAYSWQAAQPWRAAQHARHLTEPELAKAMVLQPGDAAYANMLGRYFFFARQDTAAAVPHFRKATELNRGVGRYWLDLAAAYHVENDATSEREALRHAADAEPRNPETLWETANYWLAQGELETAMQQFRAILESDEYADAALQICWRATHDVNRVDALLNASTVRQAQFLRVLGQTRKLDAAGVEWGRIAIAGRAVELPLVTPYVEALIETRLLDQATQVWRRLLELNGLAADYVAADNLVENSSFEQPLL